MATLMVIRLDWDAFFFERLIDPVAMFGHHIPIIKRMRHQHCGFYWFQVVKIISTSPKFIVVTGCSINSTSHVFIANITVAVFVFLWIATIDKVVQHVDVFSHVTTGRAHQAVGTVVMVIGCVWRDRDDCLQTFDAGCCSSQAQGAII